MYVFLGLNGRDINVGEPVVVDVMNRLPSGRLTEAAFAGRVKAHLASAQDRL